MKQTIWWISILIFVFFSCQKDKPLPTGYSLVMGDDQGQIADTLIVQQVGEETYYSRLVNTSASTSLCIGSLEDYHSAIYLKFTGLPDSADIHAAKLFLKSGPIDSTLSGFSQTFKVDIYHAKYDWKSDQDPEQYLDQLPFNDKSFQTANISPDAQNNIEIQLDTNVVETWAADTTLNYGFWIKSSDLEGINSYYSTENNDTLKPKLEIDYTPKDSSSAVRDTTSLYVSQDAFLVHDTAEALSNLNTNYFYIGKGLAFRSFLKFDLSGLDSIHINRAIMEIVINRANSIRDASGASDIIIYRKAEESRDKILENEKSTIAYTGTLTDSTLIFDVTSTVHAWINNRIKIPNYGFLVRSMAEETTISRVAFYSSKLGVEFPEFIPKLYLYYTTPPKQEL